VQSPQCKLAEDAFHTLEAGLELYRVGSVDSRPPETLASFLFRRFRGRHFANPTVIPSELLDQVNGTSSLMSWG
jgi:hypothetical protein